MSLEELQETVGILETDQGIVYLSLLDTDLYDLLEPYIATVDYRLYFDFCHRIVIKKYAKMVSTSKLSLLKKSVYYALKGEEYNLRTLINTTNLDYNPLENYELHETVVTTASIAGNIKYGEVVQIGKKEADPYGIVTTTSYSMDKLHIEKDMPERQTHTTTTYSKEDDTTIRSTTSEIGEQKNNKTDSIAYSQQEVDNTETTNVGKRETLSNSEHQVSAYNTTDYQPSYTDTNNSATQPTIDSTTGKTTTHAHTDSHTINETLGERADSTDETTNTIKEAHNTDELVHVSAIQDTDTHTHDPHQTAENQQIGKQTANTTNTTQEHETDNTQKEDGNKQRDLHGRYGFNTVQTMIESERRLANLNIADRIIDIVIHTICEGVLYLW